MAPPEPFDAKRHTLLPASAIDTLNLVGRADFVLPPRFPSKRTATAIAAMASPSPGDADKAIPLIPATSQWYGVYQVNDVGTNIVLPPRIANDTGYIYAPTMLPPLHTCIEATTIHRRGLGGPTQHYQGWYDWCQPPGGAWAFLADITSLAFSQSYVRTYLGQPTITLSIVTPTTFNGCWYAHLYDFLLGGWVQVLPSCKRPVSYSPGAFSGQYGWTAWESYFTISNTNCVSFPAIRAMNIQYADPATSQFVPITSVPAGNVGTPSISFSQCWYDPFVNTTGPYVLTYPGTTLGLPANSWHGNTTPPPITVNISTPNTVRPMTTCRWDATPTSGSAPYTYSWTVNTLVIGSTASVLYQNSGSAFTLQVTVTDKYGVTGSKSKNVSVSGSTPICTT